MSPRCLDLDHHDATDPHVAGAKAAGLAVARAAGLPVLPGVVVPVAESRPVVEAAAAALEEGSGGRARLAAMRVEPDVALVEEVRERVAAWPAPLIVRSSSPLEGDGTWSGAFSSFHGIDHDELGTAIRGCWGSAFAVGVLDRAEGTGTAPGDLGLAVLIQPELRPDLGGTARLLRDGTVRVTATTGPLRPLMAGHVEGQSATIAPDGSLGPTPIGNHGLLREIAALTREVGELLGHQLIEWAAVDGKLTLLQSIRSGDVTGDASASIQAQPALDSPVAWRVAVLAQRFPGRLGEQLVLPWAVAAPELPSLWAVDLDADPLVALATARAALDELLPLLWGGSPRAAAAEADRVLRQLRGDDPGPAIERIAALAPPTPEVAATVLRNLAIVRHTLLEVGLVDSEASFWRLEADVLASAMHERVPIAESRLGVDRWEPFLHAVVRSRGEHYEGTPAAPGAGAGRAYVLHELQPTASPAGRYVLIASEPGPALGPLLWHAAGLVTRAGSTAAHVIEFAHSIGVPTVVSCDLPDLSGEEPPMVAVDGGNGVVSLVRSEVVPSGAVRTADRDG